jgi:2-polyprenyl-6-hydroxyphenyl methylase/3-demethylubiquinone-9 3-methyltransferase
MLIIRWEIAQFFERKWWKNYLRKKNPDEYLYKKKKYWNNFISEISHLLSLTNDHQYLDLGCGPAGIFMVLPGNTIAVDPLMENYRLLSHFKAEEYKNVSFISATAEDVNINTEFDVIFCLNVINHVKDMQQCLNQIHRLCKNDGKTVISVDAHNYKFFRIVFKYLHLDILHPYQLNLSEYKKRIEDQGFFITAEKCLRRSFIFNYYVIVAVKA